MASSAPPVKGQSGQLPSSPHVAIVDAPTAIDEQRSSTASMLSVSTALTSTTHPSIWDLESDDEGTVEESYRDSVAARFSSATPISLIMGRESRFDDADFGRECGFWLWRVGSPGYSLHLLEEEDVGCFDPCSSYVVLSSEDSDSVNWQRSNCDGPTSHHIHVWVGERSKTSHVSAAALNAMHLERELNAISAEVAEDAGGDGGGGGCVVKQYREEQEVESDRFIGYFVARNGFEYVPNQDGTRDAGGAGDEGVGVGGEGGGRGDGVSHSSSDGVALPEPVRVPRMYAIRFKSHARSHCECTELKFSRASLSSAEIAIVDNGGDTIYVWKGARSTVKQRAKALELAYQIRQERISRNANRVVSCAVINTTEGEEPEIFWMIFREQQMRLMQLGGGGQAAAHPGGLSGAGREGGESGECSGGGGNSGDGGGGGSEVRTVRSRSGSSGSGFERRSGIRFGGGLAASNVGLLGDPLNQIGPATADRVGGGARASLYMPSSPRVAFSGADVLIEELVDEEVGSGSKESSSSDESNESDGTYSSSDSSSGSDSESDDDEFEARSPRGTHYGSILDIVAKARERRTALSASVTSPRTAAARTISDGDGDAAGEPAGRPARGGSKSPPLMSAATMLFRKVSRREMMPERKSEVVLEAPPSPLNFDRADSAQRALSGDSTDTSANLEPTKPLGKKASFFERFSPNRASPRSSPANSPPRSPVPFTDTSGTAAFSDSESDGGSDAGGDGAGVESGLVFDGLFDKVLAEDEEEEEEEEEGAGQSGRERVLSAATAAKLVAATRSGSMSAEERAEEREADRDAERWAQKARNSFLYMARSRKKSAARAKAEKRRSKELADGADKKSGSRKSKRASQEAGAEGSEGLRRWASGVEGLDELDATDSVEASRLSLKTAATHASSAHSLDLDVHSDEFRPASPISPRALENTLYRIGSVEGDLTLVIISTDGPHDPHGGTAATADAAEEDGAGDGGSVAVGERMLMGLAHDQLEPTGAYILDCVNEIFLWFGHKTTSKVRRAAICFIDRLREQLKRPDWVAITQIVSGTEPVAFKTKFNGWIEEEKSVELQQLLKKRMHKQLKKGMKSARDLLHSEEERVEPYTLQVRAGVQQLQSKTKAPSAAEGVGAGADASAGADEIALDDVDDNGLLLMWKLEQNADGAKGATLVKVAEELCGHVSAYHTYLFLYGYECPKTGDAHFLSYMWTGSLAPRKDWIVWMFSLAQTKLASWEDELGVRPAVERVFQAFEPPVFFKIFAATGFTIHYFDTHHATALTRALERQSSGESAHPKGEGTSRSEGGRGEDGGTGGEGEEKEKAADNDDVHGRPGGRGVNRREHAINVTREHVRMYHVHSAGLTEEDYEACIHAVEVEPSVAALVSDSVFLIVRPRPLKHALAWMWVGVDSPSELHQAAARSIEGLFSRLGVPADASIKVVDEGRRDWHWGHRSLYQALGGKVPFASYAYLQQQLKAAERAYGEGAPQLFHGAHMYKCAHPDALTLTLSRQPDAGDATGAVKPPLGGGGGVDRLPLEPLGRCRQLELTSNAVCVLDTPSKIYVWMGADTPAELRQLALDIATTAVKVRLRTARAKSKRSKKGSLQNQPPPHVMIEEFDEGDESIRFKSHFLGWNAWDVVRSVVDSPDGSGGKVERINAWVDPYEERLARLKAEGFPDLIDLGRVVPQNDALAVRALTASGSIGRGGQGGGGGDDTKEESELPECRSPTAIKRHLTEQHHHQSQHQHDSQHKHHHHHHHRPHSPHHHHGAEDATPFHHEHHKHHHHKRHHRHHQQQHHKHEGDGEDGGARETDGGDAGAADEHEPATTAPKGSSLSISPTTTTQLSTIQQLRQRATQLGISAPSVKRPSVTVSEEGGSKPKPTPPRKARSTSSPSPPPSRIPVPRQSPGQSNRAKGGSAPKSQRPPSAINTDTSASPRSKSGKPTAPTKRRERRPSLVETTARSGLNRVKRPSIYSRGREFLAKRDDKYSKAKKEHELAGATFKPVTNYSKSLGPGKGRSKRTATSNLPAAEVRCESPSQGFQLKLDTGAGSDGKESGAGPSSEDRAHPFAYIAGGGE